MVLLKGKKAKADNRLILECRIIIYVINYFNNLIKKFHEKNYSVHFLYIIIECEAKSCITKEEKKACFLQAKRKASTLCTRIT